MLLLLLLLAADDEPLDDSPLRERAALADSFCPRGGGSLAACSQWNVIWTARIPAFSSDEPRNCFRRKGRKEARARPLSSSSSSSYRRDSIRHSCLAYVRPQSYRSVYTVYVRVGATCFVESALTIVHIYVYICLCVCGACLLQCL